MDIYIKDIISLCIDLPAYGNTERMAAGVLLAINTVASPPSVDEPLLWDPMVMCKKLMEESGPSKKKTIMGWDFDFNALCLSATE